MSVRTGAESGELSLRAGGWDRPLTPGESIAVAGACLTLASWAGDLLRFDALQETFARTHLGSRKPGDRVNLERALRLGDPLGGHYVTGHVDGTGRVRSVRREGRDAVLEIAAAAELMDGLVPKGSIAVDGVSLTVAALAADSFSVHIIPTTWERTTLPDLRAGDAVNLEADLLGKYARKALQAAPSGRPVTMDSLRRAGFLG